MRLPTLVLASASPRRRRLLERLGLPVEVRPSRIDERGTDGDGRAVALTLAREKAEAVATGLDEGFVLAADTLGAFDGQILGKPAGETEALQMLWRMSDRAHEVFTGVCVLRIVRGKVAGRAEEVVATRVVFRSLRLNDIREYLQTHEYEGKAGGYAIQGRGRELVHQLEGSYTNVVGLPVVAAVRLLRAVGYPMPEVDAEALDRDPRDPEV